MIASAAAAATSRPLNNRCAIVVFHQPARGCDALVADEYARSCHEPEVRGRLAVQCLWGLHYLLNAHLERGKRTIIAMPW